MATTRERDDDPREKPAVGTEQTDGAPRFGYSYDTGLTSDDGNPVDFDVSNYTYLDRDSGEAVDYYDTTG